MGDDDMRPAVVWELPLDEMAQRIMANADRFDERRMTGWTGFLQARVAIELSKQQEATAKALVAATTAIARETQRLVKRTIWVAVGSILAALATAAVAIATVLAQPSP